MLLVLVIGGIAMLTCGNIIRCWDNTNRPCICQPKHLGGCNPFYPEPQLTSQKEVKIRKVLTVQEVVERIASRELELV